MLDSTLARLALIAAVAGGAHLATVAIRSISVRILRSRASSESKVHTITGFATSVIIFAIYFAAVGFVLSELGVSLTTYLASASVIGLAVSFGSQGIVQDVITGLTVVFSDLVDVGDMVELAGQVGIVESVGMRFTVLVNFSGARVIVPNRSIANVISYPNGYIRAYVDIRLPEDAATREKAERTATEVARAAYEQYPGILLLPPTIQGRVETQAGYSYLRIKFRIWPGQGAVLENAVKVALAQSLKQVDAHYADWMVTVHYRSETRSGGESRRLPRPAAVRRREMQSRRAENP